MTKKAGQVMNEGKTDIIVIGGGPGGYAAAGRAAQLGMKTILIEKDKVGGVCLNRGCIPTKALLESAHVFETIKKADRFGLVKQDPEFDFSRVIERSRKIADRMSKGVNFLMKNRGVEVVKAKGSILKPGLVLIETEEESRELAADHIIVATGARPVSLPGIHFDGQYILDSTDAMRLSEQPESMIIIGAGPIGMEFADFYNTFGTTITLVEMMSSVLPLEDEEIINEINRSLRRKKITALTDTKVQTVDVLDGRVVVEAAGPKGEVRLEAEKVLLSTGVSPNIEYLGLEKTGVEVDKRGFIKVNNCMQTSVSGIYAIGDVAGPPMLAHKASMEALACIHAIAGKASFKAVDYSSIPACTYCKPQVASIGLTEEKASENGYRVKKGLFPFRANGKSVAMEETDGIVKLIFNTHDMKLIGAHIVHASASDLIAEAGIAMRKEATAYDIASTVHAHPTLSEAIMEAAAAAIGEAIHV